LTARRGIAVARHLSCVLAAALLSAGIAFAEGPASNSLPRRIALLDPPEQGFYAKILDAGGIPIKAPKEVVDEALYQAEQRLALLLTNLPAVRSNLVRAGAELHIIGRDR
jgi:hypothetical protein